MSACSTPTSDMMPQVSVVIPSYNNAAYIVDAVESVLNQTFQDFEIIVIDDGSEDNTKEVLQPYIEKDLIRYIYHDNQGPGAARNTGIASARGTYIAFLDSDDTLTRNSLEKRLGLIKSDPRLGLVFSDIFVQTQGSEPTIKTRIFQDNISRFMVRTNHGIIFDGPCRKVAEIAFQIWTGTVLVKKQLFDETGLFRRDIVRAEDLDMWLRISLNHKIGYVDSPLAYYNHFRGYLTSADPLQYCLDRLDYYKYLLKIHANEKGICRAITDGMALTYCDLGSYYLRHSLRTRFILNYMKCFYYKPFGDTYRYKYFISYFVPQRLRELYKKLSMNITSESRIKQ